MIILDTNVVSEILRPAPDERIVHWLSRQFDAELFLTSITKAELYVGLAIMPEGKRKQGLADAIETFFTEVMVTETLPFGDQEALAFARIFAHRRRIGRPIADFDAQIAAIALVCDFAVATRNVRDFEGCGVKVVNPWEHS